MNNSVLASIAYPNFDPVIFRFGPLAVRWYGVAYLLGFLLAYLLLRKMVRRGRLQVTLEELTDLLGWLVAGVIVGGRAGWWLVYHRGPLETWYEPVAVWHGGMSFHGALTGVVLVLAAWSRLRQVPFLHLADSLSLVAPVGLFLGRIANFINAELVGRPTELPWGVLFPGEQVARHPSQRYEAILEGPILLMALWICRRLRLREGSLAALFLIGYGCIRFMVEFVRQPDEQVGFIAFSWLTMGQALSLFLPIIGLLLLWLLHRRPGLSPDPDDLRKGIP